MKYRILFVLLLVPACVYSQDIKTVKLGIEKDFSNVADKKFEDIVPFYQNKKWGYINKHTKKMIVPARYKLLLFFDPDMNAGEVDGFRFSVNRKGEVTVEEDAPEFMVEAAEAPSEKLNHFLVSSKDGFKGFSVDHDGKLKSYSDIYHYQTSGFETWNVMPFKRNGRYYAIVNNLQGEDAIIDTAGNEVAGFEFKRYKYILPNRYAKTRGNDDINWFFVSTRPRSYSLKSWDGKIKMKDEIFSYPLLASDRFGIGIIHEGNRYALFDSKEMKWLIKPQDKIRITSLDYSSAVKVDVGNLLDRSKVTLYYLVEESDVKYYVDLRGERYVPGK